MKNQGRTKGEGLSTAKKLKLRINIIVDRPNAALPFWLFGGFRYVVWSFIVLLVRYKKQKIGKNRLASDHLFGNSFSPGCRW